MFMQSLIIISIKQLVWFNVKYANAATSFLFEIVKIYYLNIMIGVNRLGKPTNIFNIMLS